jgi:hypothetical protein
LDIQNIVNGNDTTLRGMKIPRMTEMQRDKMLKSPGDSLDANSLMIFNIDEDCYNYYMQSEKEWRSLCGSLGKAVYSLDCSKTSVKGVFIEQNETSELHFAVITVNVTKKGIWSMTAIADPSNGYAFAGEGIFSNLGVQSVRLAAQGTPTAVKTDQFTLHPSSGANCNFNVSVKPFIANYSLLCGTSAIEGTYRKNVALTAANKIVVNVNVSAKGYYEVRTPVTNGVWFESSGVFNATGANTVTLYGYGRPTVNFDFPITVQSNSPDGNGTCSVTVPVQLPPMTYAIIGDSDYSWNCTYRKNSLLNTKQAFSPTGIVRINNFTELWRTTSESTAISNLNNGYNGVQPDIVLYFAYGLAPTTSLSTALANYVNKGGVLIYGSYDNTATQVTNLINGIFGSSSWGSATQMSTDDYSYLINTLPNVSIVNGPFGNLSGKYWGEDNFGSVYITQLPPGSTQICSAYNPNTHKNIHPDASIIWYNDKKNFMYFGDSCAAAWDSSSSNDGWPSIYNQSTGLPKNKKYGRYATTTKGEVYVHNAALELNAVAWAIYRAATSGINGL